MKHVMLLIVAISVFALAGAVVYHAQTGRYRISPVTGVAGVYKIDSKSGAISICSPVYESGCLTLQEAHRQILAQRQNVVDSAQQAGDFINQFTRDKAEGLRGVIKRLAPEDEAAPEESGVTAP